MLRVPRQMFRVLIFQTRARKALKHLDVPSQTYTVCDALHHMISPPQQQPIHRDTG